MSKDNMLVFVTPIVEGEVKFVKEAVFSTDEDILFTEVGISKYHRWVQTINDKCYLIHQMEGQKLKNSFELLKEKISQENPVALGLQSLYKAVLNVDINNDHWIPEINELTELMDMHIDNPEGNFSKEYCFVYPILSLKIEKLFKFYEDKAVYSSETIQNIFRFRGIDKYQLWIQESSGNTFLVVYQDIIGPVTTARTKFLDAKEDALSNFLAEMYSDITGLPYEKLLPTLESLDDAEVLK